MAGEPVARMVNLSTGNIIGELDAGQLGFLKKHLEAESESDTSFTFVPETAKWMREQGAVSLANLLLNSSAGENPLLVGIAPLVVNGTGRVRGRLLALENQTPLAGVKVEAVDHHLFSERLLGWAYSDAQGQFEISFSDSALGHRRSGSHAEKIPEVKIRISNEESVSGPSNEESDALPGIGLTGSIAESVVEESGAPPIEVDENAAAPEVGTEANELSVLGADEPAVESAVPEEASTEGDSGPTLIEGEIGPLSGLQTEWRDIFVKGDGELIAPVLDDAAAICPQCGSTFAKGTVTCGDCHVAVYRVP